ncbi:hypothetical protein [Spirillospora sp. CA-294931]|uniref:hypothetical protein n=1 Tax=Spirillospora sp. CA-294931 TaxID=3240042 RepID=UPI003D949422
MAMVPNQQAVERVCPCTDAAPGRAFPVQRRNPSGEDRFTRALVTDVADVLTAHGFPVIEGDGPDYYALMWCLWRYAYGDTVRGRHGKGPGAGTGAGEGPVSGADGADGHE